MLAWVNTASAHAERPVGGRELRESFENFAEFRMAFPELREEGCQLDIVDLVEHAARASQRSEFVGFGCGRVYPMRRFTARTYALALPQALATFCQRSEDYLL